MFGGEETTDFNVQEFLDEFESKPEPKAAVAPAKTTTKGKKKTV